MSQNLKFRLQNGHIYDFEYSKYSEFIDNLEPESGVIIDVLEPFTFEDFKTAQIEYYKYLVFKEALEDNITTRKLWSKEKLKEFSKYELNNPVLEWLMIRDNREDKEIKEILSLESFELHQVDKDIIILYYLVDRTNQDKFIWACKKGHFEVAQWIYLICQIPGQSSGEFFGGINIQTRDDYVFRWTCVRGHIEVAQWLYSLGGVNIHVCDEEAFRLACLRGHLEVAQWLYSLGGIDIYTQNEYAFKYACSYGRLEVAKWLWSLGGFHKDNIKSDYEDIKDWLATLD